MCRKFYVDSEMKKHNLISGDYAVSEVVGGLILVTIAVMAFSSIYMYVFPLPLPSPEPHVKLMGYVDDAGNAVIQHMGGESIGAYRIDVRNASGTLIDSTVYQSTENTWKIGECKFPPIESPLIEENDTVQITIYSMDEEGEQQIFDGILKGKTGEVLTGDAMLISSLRTNTADEDLICYNYTINPTIDALTYIYNWSIDGSSIACLLMPFDTNSSDVVKDYSGHIQDGAAVGPTWSNSGVVGGAYSFDGSNDRIELSLPSVFNDISNNDFTISMWLKSEDIGDPWRRVMEARKDTDDFVQFFQMGSEIHFGVCEDGLRRAVKTETLSSNIWYCVSGVWDASEKSLAIYVNGNVSTETGNRHYGYGSHSALHIGQRTDSSRNWLGMIDEFEVYDHTLSSEQIYQNYLCTKNGFSDKRVIVSEETNVGESWKCIVTPNDGIQDDESVESNVLDVINYGGG